MTTVILPDAIDEDRVVLIKACSHLRLTREIETAAAVARNSERVLILAIPSASTLDPSLDQFVSENGVLLHHFSDAEGSS